MKLFGPGVDIGTLIVIGVFCLIGYGLWWLRGYTKRQHEKTIADNEQKTNEAVAAGIVNPIPAVVVVNTQSATGVDNSTPPVSVPIVVDDLIDPKGKYQAYVLKDGELAPVKIKKPIGDLFTFGQTMPVPGPAYLIIQNSPITAFNPLKNKAVPGQSPFNCWDSTHYSDITAYFKQKTSMLGDIRTWIVVAMFVFAFLTMLILGG